jgi:hypothetical protein
LLDCRKLLFWFFFGGAGWLDGRVAPADESFVDVLSDFDF